ncbi:hypothetical protein [Bacillus cereus]|uniref:hypothetical protein n=1 Tax=Bacillus cereus TaxID=1396 RepID=UPI000BFDF0E1|nr:hypothetical protein [Bacillus cereus]PGO70111.1 hypothetical protein CN983_10775 [Bacillus cereus]
MIEKLIEEGIELEKELKPGVPRNYFDSILFEAWASKSIRYLEVNYADSIITEKAKKRFMDVDGTNNYDFYQFLLGSLKAIVDLHSASFQ